MTESSALVGTDQHREDELTSVDVQKQKHRAVGLEALLVPMRTSEEAPLLF